ncbi:MAG: type II toxin-antitoxin system CcdA family antitoxin [Tepidimonas sp.]
MFASPSPTSRRARNRSAARAGASQPAKRAVNLSLSADVLEDAKRLGVNVSQVCDAHLREVVRREQERRWRAEHIAFLAAYNRIVEAEGLPLQEWQSF